MLKQEQVFTTAPPHHHSDWGSGDEAACPAVCRSLNFPLKVSAAPPPLQDGTGLSLIPVALCWDPLWASSTANLSSSTPTTFLLTKQRVEGKTQQSKTLKTFYLMHVCILSVSYSQLRLKGTLNHKRLAHKRWARKQKSAFVHVNFTTCSSSS